MPQHANHVTQWWHYVEESHAQRSMQRIRRTHAEQTLQRTTVSSYASISRVPGQLSRGRTWPRWHANRWWSPTSRRLGLAIPRLVRATCTGGEWGCRGGQAAATRAQAHTYGGVRMQAAATDLDGFLRVFGHVPIKRIKGIESLTAILEAPSPGTARTIGAASARLKGRSMLTRTMRSAARAWRDRMALS